MRKKKRWAVLAAAGLTAAVLCGCRQEEAREPEEKAAAYQFVKGYGIVSSRHPVYVLDTAAAPAPQGDVTLTLVDAVLMEQNLIVNLLVTDRSGALDGSERSPEAPLEIPDRYRADLWTAGEGIRLARPGIGEDGCKPVESQYMSYPEFYEAYGYRRCFMAASFELPAAAAEDMSLTGCTLQVLDFEEPLAFSLKQAPGYESPEALAAAQGSMDTHDGLSVLATWEIVAEGILVDWYQMRESTPVTASLSHTPPSQKGSVPHLFAGETEYFSERSPLYTDKVKLYSPEGLAGRHSFRQLFSVPEEARHGTFTLRVPGITYLSAEEAEPVTIPIPERSEELTEEIAFLEGSVRLYKITKLSEEKPAVYLDVAAAEDGRGQSLRSLICQRKAGKNPGERGWENQRYDFNAAGNLCGFRIFYNEGDTEIVLKFSRPGFYREQIYEMELDLYR